MNGGSAPSPSLAGLSSPSPLQMHPDDQMFLDVFAQDLTQTGIGAWPTDVLPPLDFGNPDSPSIEYPQARSCSVGACLLDVSYIAVTSRSQSARTSIAAHASRSTRPKHA